MEETPLLLMHRRGVRGTLARQTGCKLRRYVIKAGSRELGRAWQGTWWLLSAAVLLFLICLSLCQTISTFPATTTDGSRWPARTNNRSRFLWTFIAVLILQLGHVAAMLSLLKLSGTVKYLTY